MNAKTLLAAMCIASAVISGCSCDGELAGGDGGLLDGEVVGLDATMLDGSVLDGTVPGDGSTTDMDATTLDSGGSEGGVVILPDDGGFLLPDGAIVDCLPATCGGRTYACGDCVDNDGDGSKDSRDDGCIGPCDNSEDVYDLEIPGGDTPTCIRDCYYDQNQGGGDDGCGWDERCDPLTPDALCPFTPPGGPVRCPATQPAMCLDVCLPLVPNGCDCFGCCELPATSGRYVFLGSQDASGTHTCTPENILDDTRCHPCTPVPGCLNTCGHCELCLGRTTLPADCFPPIPVDGGVLLDDAGNPIDAGSPPDAGPQPDAGTPPPRCDPGRQACGLPGDPACPASYYCLTGCCVFFG